MLYLPADRRTGTLFPLLVALLLGMVVSAPSKAEDRNRQKNPLRAQATPVTPQAPADAQLVSYVTEPFASEYVVDGGCDTAVGCAAPVECLPSSCGVARPCLPLWASIEYLLWWEKGSRLPPLVSASPAGTDRDQAGIIGDPDTVILFGGESVDADTVSGARLTVGGWIDGCQNTGLGVRLFAMEENTVGFAADSDDFPILARPFYNAFTDEFDAVLLGFPDELEGAVHIGLQTETTGGQAFVRQLFRSGCNYRLDLIYGYRYLQVKEWLGIRNAHEFTEPDQGNFGTEIAQRDLFAMENEYHGGELGLMGQSADGSWTLDFLATVAFGEMRERVAIRGESVVTPLDGDPVDLVGGLLTQRSNIGFYEQSPFTVVPEASVSVGYYLTPSLNFSVGYTFLYVNNLIRAGRIVDTAVNLTQQTGDLEGPARPAFRWRESDYWLQGINFGLNWRY
jgi:hypothetical protein